MIFRPAKLEDISQIRNIERKYYEGFNCPEDTLKSWIEQLSKNFIVAEENNRIVGFIFFEYLNEVKAVPLIHKIEHKIDGKYVYISEVGICDNKEQILQQLFDKLVEKVKKDNCEKIIWLTGQKHKHDQIESRLLINNKFEKVKNIKDWEAYPNHFVSDHWIWQKSLR